MDKVSTQTYLNTLKEIILDEGRLITYVSISRELCIHVNECKCLLEKIINFIRKDHPNVSINVCFIVSGLSDENKALTTVCSEADLDTIKASLKTIFFQHIYSVGKACALDNVSLMAVNKFDDLPLCTGMIKGKTCVKHTVDEIGNLKSNSQELAVIDTKSVIPLKRTKAASTTEKKLPVEESCNSSTVAKPHETKSEPSIKIEIPPSKIDHKKDKSQKGIAGFFSKSNSVPPKPKSKVDINSPQDLNSGKINHEIVSIKKEKMDVDETVTEKTTKELTKPENKPKLKSLTNIRKNATIDKKRKRVLQVSDSESDDEKKDPFLDETPINNVENLLSDDEIPPTPLANTVKITSGIVNPKKRRKIVDRTYRDEDGYILTKKEEIYESCSENEVEPDESKESKENLKQIVVKNETSPKKKNGTKNTKNKASSPQKGKQATLMNFFKKV